jgi:hypothetical protein
MSRDRRFLILAVSRRHTVRNSFQELKLAGEVLKMFYLPTNPDVPGFRSFVDSLIYGSDQPIDKTGDFCLAATLGTGPRINN